MEHRVKLYTLNQHGQWEDRGIGKFTVTDERIRITDEADPTSQLLEYSVGSESYRKQEDSIIIWTGTDYISYAISFQDQQEANEAIEKLCELQGSSPFEASSGLASLPSPTPENIAIILDILADPLLEKFELNGVIQHSNFIVELGREFTKTEENSKTEALPLYCIAYKILLQYLSENILKTIFCEDAYLPFFGALEYDPDLHNLPIPYRAALSNQMAFNNLLDASDSVFIEKVHLAFRLQFFKDSPSFKLLDDPTAAFAANFLVTVWTEIVEYFMDSNTLQERLREKLKAHEFPAFSFLSELVSILKNIQIVTRSRFYETVFNDSFMKILSEHWEFPHWDALQRQKFHATITDLFCSMGSVSPAHLNLYLTRDLNSSDSPFLIKFASQVHKTLEPDTVQSTAEFISLLIQDETDIFCDILYDSVLLRTLQTIQSLPESEEEIICITEILSLFTHLSTIHYNKIRSFIILNDVIPLALSLIKSPHNSLQLAAIRFMKSLISKADLYITKIIINNNYLLPIFNLWAQHSTRENLIFSAIYSLVKEIEKIGYIRLTDYTTDTLIPSLPPTLQSLCQLRVKNSPPVIPPRVSPPLSPVNPPYKRHKVN